MDLPDIHAALKLHQSGKFGEAEVIYKDLIHAQPNNFDAQHLLGIIFLQRGLVKNSVDQIRLALKIKPNDPSALSNLGNALSALKLPKDALEVYDRAIAIKPNFADAYNNRGNALKDLKRFSEALTSFDKAEAIDPNRADTHLNRGTVLKILKKYNEAIISFDRAIALNPKSSDAYNNRGNALKELGRYDEAIESFNKSILINPNSSLAYANKGNTLSDINRFEEALICYDKARLLPSDQTLVDGFYIHTKMLLNDWENYDLLTEALRKKVTDGQYVTTPFSFLALPSSPHEQLLAAQRFMEMSCPPAKPLWNGEIYKHKKIKIAYLSADYHEHATTHLMAGLFESHNRDKFETVAFSFGRNDPGPVRERLLKSFDEFIQVSHLSDDQIALLIKEREIDIAVDLKGYTKEGRSEIFARRPAPIQVNYLGYPGTLAAPYIDYIVADHVLIPEELKSFYTEKIVYMPNSYQINDNKKTISDIIPNRAELGLPEDAFVFCCFNNNYKITPDVFDVWMRILKNVDNSVLWLLEKNPKITQTLRNEAEKRGVSADRIIFAKKWILSQHLARHKQADLFLDTLPYNAHTTASDALWAGLPVLTCIGETFASRVASSLLNAVGLGELTTYSLDQYEKKAIHLATNPSELSRIKNKLSANLKDAPLFDTEKFTRDLERAYTLMWQRYQESKFPEEIDLSSFK